MSEPFLAECRIVAFNFAPRGWAFCDGQILPINQNQSLYSLLGTTYGGDGRTTFALPDLRGRSAIHVGRSDGGAFHNLGSKTGEETVTLTVAEMPQHRHEYSGTSQDANNSDPTGHTLARSVATEPYRAATNMVDMGIQPSAGGSQAHENMMPYLAVNFVIALQGLFPSRN